MNDDKKEIKKSIRNIKFRETKETEELKSIVKKYLELKKSKKK